MMHPVSLFIFILLMSELVLPFSCVPAAAGCGQKFSTSKGLLLHKNYCEAIIRLWAQVKVDKSRKCRKRRQLEDTVSLAGKEEELLIDSETAQAGTSIQVCSKYIILVYSLKLLICRQLTIRMWICQRLCHCCLQMPCLYQHTHSASIDFLTDSLTNSSKLNLQ